MPIENSLHWSRHPNQIKHDRIILNQCGLVFLKDKSGFHRFGKAKESPLKNLITDLLIEKKFEGKKGPEYDAAEFIYEKWTGFWSA